MYIHFFTLISLLQVRRNLFLGWNPLFFENPGRETKASIIYDH